MSKALTVSLTDEQRTFLRTLTTSGSSPARVQTRARILLLTDRSQGERLTDKDIAAALRVSLPTIGTTRRRFAVAQTAGQDAFGQDALDAALCEKPRPGQTPKIIKRPRSPATSKRTWSCLPVVTRPRVRPAGRFAFWQARSSPRATWTASPMWRWASG